jgi:2-dehydro-3-deoxy-D-gluconate 5-dehydrogenase
MKRYIEAMTLFSLSGKVAIVTGGNSGIGLGMAQGLAEAGATVVIAGRNQEKSLLAVQTITQAGGSAIAVQCDVSNQNSVQQMVDEVLHQCQHIHILVNNAGINIRKRPEDLSFAEWRKVMDTNLDSAFLCSQACYLSMKTAGGGKILNNGSMLSLFGSPWGSAYAASKGGIVQLTKALATAWASDNIQVNCFLPGWIDTPMTVDARNQVEGLNERVLARTPAKRWGNIDDFRGIAVFLASSASDFITGTVIPVDGGFSSSVL